MSTRDLTIEINNTLEAIEVFVSEYIERMQYPVKIISSVVANLDQQADPLVNKANLETLHRTLLQMDETLDGLVETLEEFQCKTLNVDSALKETPATTSIN
jgi:light-regulated signal transduction histidine kinase (bacteriophytochrome)